MAVKLILSRTYQQNETLGTLFVMDGHKQLFTCVSLELPWKNNEHNVSCISEGVYDTIKYDRPNGKGKCFWLQNVKNRSAILIHSGNYATGKKVDIEGCILVGSKFSDINADGELDIVESTLTLNKLLEILPNSFKLTII